PSHVGILGNKEVDKLAVSARGSSITFNCLPYQDLKPLLRKSIFLKWQLEWDTESNNKLHIIKPILGVWESSYNRERRVEVLLCRLRVGHTRVTHQYLLHGEDVALCEHCGELLTVLHILWHCSSHQPLRQSCFLELFRDHLPFHPSFLLGDKPLVPFSRILDFLKQTGYIYHL
ncbi:uncharacterized protein LOC120842402, partial [Ixodes scapularis]|uniref:uncharacterized protein LOC120842402 n=1 Tax=Ixodes scapularis TaxID=6945 RepID=UPI001A9FF7E3